MNVLLPSRTKTIDPWVEELARTVASSTAPLLPHGRRSKTWLSNASAHSAQALDISSFAGVVTYDSTEFLITARAGTTLGELQATLADRGQYLPCDPLFIEAGGTIGGTVASGISGSSRLLYGTLRDFVMEVQFVDGLGKVVRGGGKVVKNAAGFDLPKLMVGSYGRLGILTELTLKVYPRPSGAVTLLFAFDDTVAALQAMQRLMAKPLPLAAADLTPTAAADHWQLATRFAAPLESLESVASRAEAIVGRKIFSMLGPEPFLPVADPANQASDPADSNFWRAESGFIESPDGSFLVRVAMGPNDFVRLEQARQQQLSECQVRYTGGCSIAWLRGRTMAQLESLQQILLELNLSAVLVAAGDLPAFASNPGLTGPWLGNSHWCTLSRRIQSAIDPNGRFVPF